MSKNTVFEMKWLLMKDVIVLYVNHTDKRFYLAEARSCIAHVDHMFSRQVNMESFRQVFQDLEDGKLEVSILETNMDKLIRQMKLLEYRNDLLDKGYVEYVRTRYAKASVKYGAIAGQQGDIHAGVYLALAGRPKTMLGVFRTMAEAKAFVDRYYPEGKVSVDNLPNGKLVMDDGELSKIHLQKMIFDNHYEISLD